jgi:hypothetical protein
LGKEQLQNWQNHEIQEFWPTKKLW